MSTPLLTNELSADEVSHFMAGEKIKRFAPINCAQCGSTGPFQRRVFRIQGKHRMDRERTQDLFRRHIFDTYGLQNVFFRTFHKVDHVDVAICGKCGSTAVAFDIAFDDGLYEDLSKKLGTSKEEVRAGLSMMQKMLEKGS